MVCEVHVCENQEIAEPWISAEQTTSTFRGKCSKAMSSSYSMGYEGWREYGSK